MILYKGTIITPLNEGGFSVIENGFLGVENGNIVYVSNKLPLEYENVVDYSDCLILPGFIDTHTHLSQYGFVGLGEHSLLKWLENYTFPHEILFKDLRFAKKCSEFFFEECLKLGTTTVVAYATSSTDATDIAFESAKQKGIRAYIGKVMMEREGPSELLQNIDHALDGYQYLYQKWKNHSSLHLVVTPRFAITCSQESLEKAGKFAKQNNLFIQTHLSESQNEISHTLELFPWAQNYTEIYDKTGILGEKTLLAHGIHLLEDEKELIKKRKSKIVHCPTSNRFLRSGSMPYFSHKKKELQISLGTDVAGGYSLSMAHEMKEAIETSKGLQDEALGVLEALFLATLAGAYALNQEKEIGSLEKGKKADFIVINTSLSSPSPAYYQKPLERLSQFIYRNHPHSIVATYCDGKEKYKIKY